MSRDSLRTTGFVVLVVLGVFLLAEIASAALGDGASAAVYGGALAILADMYWRQRRINRIVLDGLDEIKKIVKEGKRIPYSPDAE